MLMVDGWMEGGGVDDAVDAVDASWKKEDGGLRGFRGLM